MSQVVLAQVGAVESVLPAIEAAVGDFVVGIPIVFFGIALFSGSVEGACAVLFLSVICTFGLELIRPRSCAPIPPTPMQACRSLPLGAAALDGPSPTNGQLAPAAATDFNNVRRATRRSLTTGKATTCKERTTMRRCGI